MPRQKFSETLLKIFILGQKISGKSKNFYPRIKIFRSLAENLYPRTETFLKTFVVCEVGLILFR